MSISLVYVYVVVCRHSGIFQSRVLCQHSGVFQSRELYYVDKIGNVKVNVNYLST